MLPDPPVLPPPDVLPPIVNVLFTTGQTPLLVQDLKCMVCVPLAIDRLVTSMSYGVAPMVVVELLSIENPNALGVRPLQPTLWARTEIGDVVVVPFTGLATVIFDAKAACAEIAPESTARTERKRRRRCARRKQPYFC
jgi:hypothetical protein